MISTSHLARLDRLLSRLPFHLDDVHQANLAFQRWVKFNRLEDQQIVDIWTYCFIWRNLIVKFTRDPELNESDFDMLVARVFERILERRYTVRDEGRYTNWVSVICRNFFVNYLRSRKELVPIDDPELLACVEEPQRDEEDLVILRQILRDAIARLPAYLREIVEMRLLEQTTYEDISEKQGKSVQVIRSYFNKAKLREDELLRKLIQRDFREDIENGGMTR